MSRSRNSRKELKALRKEKMIAAAYSKSKKDAAEQQDNELRYLRGACAGCSDVYETTCCSDREQCHCYDDDFDDFEDTEKLDLMDRLDGYERDMWSIREKVIRVRRRFSRDSSAWFAFTELLQFIDG